ncbi:MAG: DNA repair protein RecO [Ruminococcaceae bacterium]|nr:DNA repair protein RecO [Oscillospiraceae bacterium]
MYIKTEGIVLRETEYKDNDKLLTVLTKDLGKITVKAVGVKSQRSRLKAACQLLSFSEMTLLEHQGRYTLTEGSTKEMFTQLRNDIELLYLATYFAQVCDAVAQEDDPNPEILSLLLNCLYALTKLKKPQLLVKAVFELRLMCIVGFLPDLRGCLVCGNEQADRFNITQGVVQCAGCSAGGDIRMPLSAGTLMAMRYLAYCDAKKLFSFALSDGGIQELSDIAESYLSMRLERGFSTLDFYKSLFI